MSQVVPQAKQGISSTDSGVLIAAYSQASADKIKQSLSLRNEPVQAVTHEALLKMSELPSLLVLDLNGVQTVAPFQAIVETVPTLVLSPVFQENVFLTLYDWGALDFLVHPLPESYLMAKILQGLKLNQSRQQMKRNQDVLLELGVISARSSTLTTPHMLSTLKKAVDDHYLNPEVPRSLVVVQWTGMPLPCPVKLESSIYQDIARYLNDVARTNDVVGEFLEEKFVVLLPNTGVEGATAFAGRLAEKLKQATFIEKIKLNFSVGIAQYFECDHYEQWFLQALDKLTPIGT